MICPCMYCIWNCHRLMFELYLIQLHIYMFDNVPYICVCFPYSFAIGNTWSIQCLRVYIITLCFLIQPPHNIKVPNHGKMGSMELWSLKQLSIQHGERGKKNISHLKVLKHTMIIIKYMNQVIAAEWANTPCRTWPWDAPMTPYTKHINNAIFPWC